MRKMHLGARVPSEGARLLAGWIATHARGSLTIAGKVLSIDAEQLQRMLAGELVPGDTLGEPLFRRAGIDRLLFQRDPHAGWFAASPTKLAA